MTTLNAATNFIRPLRSLQGQNHSSHETGEIIAALEAKRKYLEEQIATFIASKQQEFTEFEKKLLLDQSSAKKRGQCIETSAQDHEDQEKESPVEVINGSGTEPRASLGPTDLAMPMLPEHRDDEVGEPQRADSGEGTPIRDIRERELELAGIFTPNFLPLLEVARRAPGARSRSAPPSATKANEPEPKSERAKRKTLRRADTEPAIKHTYRKSSLRRSDSTHSPKHKKRVSIVINDEIVRPEDDPQESEASGDVEVEQPFTEIQNGSAGSNTEQAGSPLPGNSSKPFTAALSPPKSHSSDGVNTIPCSEESPLPHSLEQSSTQTSRDFSTNTPIPTESSERTPSSTPIPPKHALNTTHPPPPPPKLSPDASKVSDPTTTTAKVAGKPPRSQPREIPHAQSAQHKRSNHLAPVLPAHSHFSQSLPSWHIFGSAPSDDFSIIMSSHITAEESHGPVSRPKGQSPREENPHPSSVSVPSRRVFPSGSSAPAVTSSHHLRSPSSDASTSGQCKPKLDHSAGGQESGGTRTPGRTTPDLNPQSKDSGSYVGGLRGSGVDPSDEDSMGAPENKGRLMLEEYAQSRRGTITKVEDKEGDKSLEMRTGDQEANQEQDRKGDRKPDREEHQDVIRDQESDDEIFGKIDDDY